MPGRTLVVPPDAESLRQRWRTLIAAPGGQKETLFLRHTCASLLFQRNVHPRFVQELLVHASIAITLDTYSRMLLGMGGEAAIAMEDALSGDR